MLQQKTFFKRHIFIRAWTGLRQADHKCLFVMRRHGKLHSLMQWTERGSPNTIRNRNKRSSVYGIRVTACLIQLVLRPHSLFSLYCCRTFTLVLLVLSYGIKKISCIITLLVFLHSQMNMCLKRNHSASSSFNTITMYRMLASLDDLSVP